MGSTQYQYRQINHTDDLQNDTQNEKRERRMVIGWIDKLNEKRHKKENGFRIDEADAKGSAKRCEIAYRSGCWRSGVMS